MAIHHAFLQSSCYRRLISVVIVEQCVGALLCCRLSLAVIVVLAWFPTTQLFFFFFVVVFFYLRAKCTPSLVRWSGEFAPTVSQEVPWKGPCAPEVYVLAQNALTILLIST